MEIRFTVEITGDYVLIFGGWKQINLVDPPNLVDDPDQLTCQQNYQTFNYNHHWNIWPFYLIKLD